MVCIRPGSMLPAAPGGCRRGAAAAVQASQQARLRAAGGGAAAPPPSRFVRGAELRQQGQADFARQALRSRWCRRRCRPAARRRRAGRDQRLDGRRIGAFAQAAEIQDDRGALEQFRRAAHAIAHFSAQIFCDVERADAQVGDADLADLEFAGLFVIDGIAAMLRCRWRAAGVRPGRARRGQPGLVGQACRRRSGARTDSCTVP